MSLQLEQLVNLISNQEVDFGKQSSDYRTHRPGMPDSFYQRIIDACKFHGVKLEGKEFDWEGLSILDLGTGPGLTAISMAKLGANVVGVDIAKNQIEEARKFAEIENVSKKCRFEVATAENTNQPSNYFDIVIATTAWHWFKQPDTMNEMKRILKKGGILIIAQFVYLSKRSEVAEKSEALVLKYNPKWTLAGHDGMYSPFVEQLVNDGKFGFIEQFCYDHMQEFSHDSWRGRMRTCNGVGSSSLSPEQVANFDKDLADMLKEKFPEPVKVWHRVFTVIVRNE